MLSNGNSVLGTTAGGGSDLTYAFDELNQQLVVGRPADTIVTIFHPETVTRSPDLTSYLPGTVITLTATASPTSIFTGWSGAVTDSGNPITLTVNEATNVTATFGLAQRRYFLPVLLRLP